MSLQWPPNPFLVFVQRAAAGTIADAAKHTNDRLAAVGATDTEVQSYYTEYHPIWTDWYGKYGQIDFAQGQQEAATETIEESLEAITPKVAGWDIAVQAAGFMKGTAGYKAFFPDGRAAFTKGKREDRIAALHGLSLAMAPISALDAKRAEVNAAEAALSAQDTTQTNKKGNRTQLSLDIKAGNAALAQALYGVMGGLMHRYRATPDEVATFFRLDLIRRAEQRDYTGDVAGDAIECIVQRSLEPDDEVALNNDGDSPLIFYFAATKTAEPDGEQPIQQLDPGGQTTVLAAALGASATNKYLLVKNKTSAEGHWRVEL